MFGEQVTSQTPSQAANEFVLLDPTPVLQLASLGRRAFPGELWPQHDYHRRTGLLKYSKSLGDRRWQNGDFLSFF